MRVTTLARRAGSVALVAALGLGLAACGENDSESGESSASDSSGDVSEAKELSADDFYPAVMGALQDAETFAMETISESDGQKQTMTGHARYSDDGMAMKASSEVPEPMEMIILDKMLYMKSEGMTSDGKWLAIDLDDEDSLFGMLGKSMDPEVMFGAAQKPEKVELLGQEEVDGVETNHYRITTDPAEALKAMDMPPGMEEFMPEDMIIEMWVDADDRPRKFVQETTVKAPSGGTVTSSVEGYYRDFGADVDIEAPPADEISDEDPFGGLM